MLMRFIKLDSSEQATSILFDELEQATQKYHKVSWLVSGGSNIKIAADAFKKLDDASLAKLTIALADERFGDPGHADSNYYQLERAGIDFNRVNHYQVLGDQATDLESATTNYAKIIDKIFEESDYVIGQLGIGSDGHTAGILPGSPAVDVVDRLLTSYQADDYSRITLTFKGLTQISKALVFVFGENKREAILNLADKELSLSEQPAQIFKQMHEADIINDITGDK